MGVPTTTTVEDIKAIRKIAEAKPTSKLMRQEFPNAKITETPDGKWTMDLKGPKQIRKFVEMTRTYRKLDSQRGSDEQSKLDRVEMRDARGNIKQVPAVFEDQLGAKKGFRRTSGPRWGRRRVRVMYNAAETEARQNRPVW